MINRLLGMIYVLMNKGTVTAGELAERFEVSVRTVYRDVESLSMAGIPVYARKGKNGGISLTENFVLDRMMISQEEQHRILAALVSLQEVGAQEEGEILRKLGEFFRAEPVNWVSIDFSDWSGRNQELFDRIREAVLGRRVMAFDYYGQYGEKSHRTVEPVQLLFKDYTWYVRAFCRTRQAMRMFKVRRMKRVQVLEESFAQDGILLGRPENDLAGTGWETDTAGKKDMSQEEVVSRPAGGAGETGMSQEKVPGTAGSGQMPVIVMRIHKKEAWRVYDKFEEEEITVLPQGDFLIRICYFLDDWVYGLILSFGPSAKVLEPESVRAELARRLHLMQQLYL